jgi:hypothetical protein
MNALRLILLVGVAVCVATAGSALALPVDPYDAVANWTAGRDPASGSAVAISTWDVVTHSDQWNPPAGIVNDGGQVSYPRGSLTSDFVTTGEFRFSGWMRATGPCADGGSFGIVFGWQDPANTYYLGWSGYRTTGPGVDLPGLSLVRNENGQSTTLASYYSLLECTWVENGWYSFDLVWSGDELSVTVEEVYGSSGLPSTYPFSANLPGVTSMSGSVGFWASGQGAEWGNLDLETSPVPEPATLLLIGSGLLGLVGLRRKWRRT